MTTAASASPRTRKYGEGDAFGEELTDEARAKL